MNQVPNNEQVGKIMLDFAELTGLEPISSHPKRYLWTDAFAVCNFLELSRQTKKDRFLQLALRLVDQVHHTLGRHRSDDSRTGWISGLGNEEGERHPTIGGLRIGKPLNERKPEEPADPALEWEQDGQYYHYLTKWMHALERTAEATEDSQYLRWAVELAKKTESAFVHLLPSSKSKRMYWKMSIDLSYPLVASMGQHDALDGFVTYSELNQASKKALHGEGLDLAQEISGISKMLEEGSWITEDSLGIGGLLFDASRIGQLVASGLDLIDLLESVLDSSLLSMRYFSAADPLSLPADYRLAFRELGLSIGLRGVEWMSKSMEQNDIFSGRKAPVKEVKELQDYLPLADKIEGFWIDSRNQRIASWTEHREINMVMLATSLAPHEFLSI